MRQDCVKIMVAIPCNERPEALCMESLFKVAARSRRYAELDVRLIRGYSCEQARNEAVRIFLESDAQYLWFVDSDILLGEDALEKLLLANCDIISGIYFRKWSGDDRTAEVCRLEDDRTIFYRESELPADLFSIAGCGCGCLLIRREVIEQCLKAVDGGTLFRYSFDPLISEDLWFCNVASSVGYQLMAHGSARLGHLGQAVY